MSDPEQLGRIAAAAERIATALEALAQDARPRRPLPHLAVARSPTDTAGRAHPVNLHPDGMLTVLVQNTGDAETTLSKPTVHLGQVAAPGQVVGRDNALYDSAVVLPAKQGPGVTLQFQLERRAHQLFGDEPMLLRLPHSPGRYPGITVLEVRLEAAGPRDGTAGWRVSETREIHESDASV